MTRPRDIGSFDLSINITDSHIKRANSNHEPATGDFWDPVESICLETINENNLHLLSLNEYYNDNKQDIEKLKKNALILGVSGTAISILLFLAANNTVGILYFGIPISWIYYFYSKNKYINPSTHLETIELATINNWIYNHFEDRGKWLLLDKKYPEIFNKGNKQQYIHDQIWGKVTPSTTFNSNFLYGAFHYAEESGYGHNKSTSTYNEFFYIISHNSTITTRFQLYPANIVTRLTDHLEMNINDNLSEELKDIYNISFYPKAENNMNEVISFLTKNVQDSIVIMAKHIGCPHILFTEDSIIFYGFEQVSPTEEMINCNDFPDSVFELTILNMHSKNLIESLEIN